MMKKNPLGTVAVVGPGGIGTLIAAHLARFNRQVLLIGRSTRWLIRARKKGIDVSGEEFGQGRRFKNERISPTIEPSGPHPGAAFFCVKSGDTSAAIARIRRWIGPDTAVISLQNGLAHRPLLLAAFGKKRMVFGACYLAVERLGSTSIRHHGGSTISLAINRDNAQASQKARALLREAGFNVRIERSEERLLWTKAAFNTATNPLGALTGRSNKELADLPQLRELMLRGLKEAIAAARAGGHAVSYAPLKRQLLSGLRSTGDQPNSMLQDLSAGRLTELDSIVKPFLLAARKKRMEIPLLDSLYRFTQRLEQELHIS